MGFSPFSSFNWVSSLEARETHAIDRLTTEMSEYYSRPSLRTEYYEFTNTMWSDTAQIPNQEILDICKRRSRVLEVGCGRAHILTALSEWGGCYTGADFSAELMDENQVTYPEAKFVSLQPSQPLPFDDNAFDVVFSHFVLEHCTRPSVFLDECSRVLAPGGRLIVFCPDFLGRARMSSQRLGATFGTGREKLKAGRYFDALMTFVDGRVRLPLKSRIMRKRANACPRFYINLDPVCLSDTFDGFFADIDAVYLTYGPEIKNYLSQKIVWQSQAPEIEEFCHVNNLLFLAGQKIGDAGSS